MPKGVKFGGGSRKGRPNKFTSAKRELAAKFLTDELEASLWQKFFNSEDERIAFDAFKLAKSYKSCQPPKAPEDRSNDQQVVITVRHINGTP